MPAKCGSLGPMICLNGATCNESTGFCENCPTGFRDDWTLFRGNRNCGLNEVAAYVVYIFTTIIALLVAAVAFRTCTQRKKSRLKLIILLIGAKNALVPFYLLAHWLEGFTHGVAATILYVSLLCIANIFIGLLVVNVETFMALACNLPKISERQKEIFRLAVFWFICKIAFGLTMIIGVASNDDDVFNAGQIGLQCSLVLEISTNVIRWGRTSDRIVRKIKEVHSDLKISSSMNPVLIDFAKRIEDNRWLMPVYGLGYFLASIAEPVLFIVYQSSIPYAVIIWAVITMTWPVAGGGPLLMLRTKFGAQMDKPTTSKGKTSEGASDNQPPPRANAMVVAPVAE